jgi:prepilin-type N-terminal cleavage/methylation domain-containing protein
MTQLSGTRDGFSIIEVVVAMVLLAIILTTLAGFTFTTTRSAIQASDAATREAASLELMNRLTTLPFNMLQAQTGYDTVEINPQNRYERHVQVSMAPGDRTATVVITTTPLQRNVPATVVRFVRPGPLPPSPLCVSGSC